MARVRRTAKVKSGRTAKSVKVLKKNSDTSISEAFDFTLSTIENYIRTRAYYIWEELGKPQGKDEDIWRKAEKDILTKLIKK